MTMKMQPWVRQGVARAILATSLLLGAASLLSACNTTAGAGKDISATGAAVTNTADKAKQGL